MSRPLVFTLAALLSASAFAGSAEDYLHSAPVRSALLAAAAPWDSALSTPTMVCGSDASIEVVTPVSALTPFSFDTKGKPIQGAWVTRFARKHCGLKTYTALCMVQAAQPICQVYVPGTSQAAPVLVKDTLRTVLPAAAIKLDQKLKLHCEDPPRLADTQVSQSPGADASWAESWTFQGCGESVTVNVKFVGDGKGGAYFVAQP